MPDQMNPAHVRVHLAAADAASAAPVGRLIPIFLIALVAALVLLLAGARPALADGHDEGDIVVRDEDDADENDADADDDDDDTGATSDLSAGTTAGDVSAATDATGDSGRDGSNGTTNADVSAQTARTGDSGFDGSRGTTQGDESGVTGDTA